MERLSVVVVAVCLLAGLSECQTGGGEDKQNEIAELTHEDPADPRVEEDALQNLDTFITSPATSSPATQPSCDPTLYTVLKELGALEEKLEANVRALEETNKKLEASEKKLTGLELSAVNQGWFRIAFSATLSLDGTIGPVNIQYALVYDRVLSNIGGHYSPVTGYFTAPVRGVYYFTFKALWWGGVGSSGGSLYHNENRIVSWYTHSPDHTASGSNSVVLQLKVGDHVNVRLWEDRQIANNGNNYSTFSGFLLFPL